MKKLLLLGMFVPCTMVVPMNVVRPFKFLYNPPPHYGTRWQVFARPEYGFRGSAFNSCQCRVNPAHVWSPNQDALAMICGQTELNDLCPLSMQCGGATTNNRGHVDVCADMDVGGCTLAFRRAFPRNIMLGFFLPFYSMRLSSLRWHDRTGYTTSDDLRVHEYITDNLDNFVATRGCLNLAPWRRTGPGDLAIVGDWLQDFYQARQVLKNVRLDARFGLTLPTGLQECITQPFSIPFGYNGSVALIFGGGLALTLGDCMHAGFDVELRKIFTHARQTRIKTSLWQTEPLLLQRTCVYNDYGIEQQYTLFGELFDLIPGLSCKLAYQFFKRGASDIALAGDCSSTMIAATGEQFGERVWHEVIPIVSYDFGNCFSDTCMRCAPTISLYGEFPFRGKRVIVCPILGAIVNVDF